MLKELFAGVGIFLASIFGGGEPAQPQPASLSQPASAIVTLGDVAAPASPETSTSTTTIVNQYITQPVIEREVLAQNSITREELDASLAALRSDLLSVMSNSLPKVYTIVSAGPAAPVSLTTFAHSQKIDQLANVSISNVTVSGVIGLTNADIPDDITASNYLPLSGGSLTFASSTLFSVFNGAYFGATATSSFDSAGALTLATPLAITSGGTGGTSTSTARAGIGVSYSTSTAAYLNYNLAAWGDSLTASTGGQTPYTTTLSSTLGRPVQNSGVGGETSSQILTRFLAATTTFSYTTIIWVGENNYSDAATVMADIAAMVAKLQVANNSNYFVLSILNGNYSCEFIGQSCYNQIISLNNNLAATYGAHYLDVRSFLVSQYDPLNAQDVIDYANDTVPSSLRYDNRHLTASGNALVAQRVANAINSYETSTQTVLTPVNLPNIFASPFPIGATTQSTGFFSSLAVATTSSFGAQPFTIYTGNTANANSGLVLTRGSANSIFGFKLKSDGTGYYRGALTVQNNTSAEIEAMSFDPVTGYVGIGTTSPASKLSVSGDGYFTGLLSLKGTTGTTTLASGQGFTIGDSQFVLQQGSGNIGIGTSSPNAKLEVAGKTYLGDLNIANPASQGVLVYTGNSGNASVGIDIIRGSSWSSPTGLFGLRLISNASGVYRGGMGFSNGAFSESMTFLPNGFIGIGTTSPSSQLDVSTSNANTSLTTFSQPTISITNTNGTNNSFSSLAFRSVDVPNGSATSTAQISGVTTLHNTNQVSGDLAFLTNRNGTLSEKLRITSAGDIGIGTTTPWRKLSITGTVGFDGLTGSTGAGSLCLSANLEVVYNSGSDSCLSSTRATKHDITALNLSALDMVAALQPVSFIYNNDASSTVRYGFIAEDAAAVDAHLATYDAAGEISGIDDRSIISIVVKAIQQLRDRVESYFARTEQLEARVAALEAQLAASGVGQSSATSEEEEGAPDTEAPVITINGNNPATIAVGDTYNDLGATVTDNVDPNLGIQVFVGSTPFEQARIDTSEPNEWHIHYVATDNAGNTATSTRTVIIEAPSITPSDAPEELSGDEDESTAAFEPAPL